LIIDDDPEDRARIIRIPQNGFPGPRCVEVSRKRELNTALAHRAFDLVITESRLQWIDALKLLRTIKSFLPHTPIVGVSHQIDEEGLLAGIKSGLSDVVWKKHLHRLRTAVYENLERARETQEHEQTIQRFRLFEERYRTIAELTADYAYSLLSRLSHRSRLRGYVCEIKNVAEQGAMLTRQLMAISRGQLLQP